MDIELVQAKYKSSRSTMVENLGFLRTELHAYLGKNEAGCRRFVEAIL
jgi:hypothetical protein